jgi:membrane complex biogenesis BtpA family protein
MVHLLPLPGSPRAAPMEVVLERALADAGALLDSGFDGLVVENFGDAPFLPGAVEPVTVAAMARAMAAVQALAPGIPLVANVLRNDARSALGLAAALSLHAIRVNVHVGARVTDQGLIQGLAHETARLRAAWAPSVRIWADLRVKHSAPLGAERPLVDEAKEAVGRGLADAVIVTGSGTGVSVADVDLADARRAGAPVLAGSGVDERTVAAVLAAADGAIVGTATKVDGQTTAPVDPHRARAIVRAAGL